MIHSSKQAKLDRSRITSSRLNSFECVGKKNECPIEWRGEKKDSIKAIFECHHIDQSNYDNDHN